MANKSKILGIQELKVREIDNKKIGKAVAICNMIKAFIFGKKKS